LLIISNEGKPCFPLKMVVDDGLELVALIVVVAALSYPSGHHLHSSLGSMGACQVSSCFQSYQSAYQIYMLSWSYLIFNKMVIRKYNQKLRKPMFTIEPQIPKIWSESTCYCTKICNTLNILENYVWVTTCNHTLFLSLSRRYKFEEIHKIFTS